MFGQKIDAQLVGVFHEVPARVPVTFGELVEELRGAQAMTTLLPAADEYPPGLVLRATLALDFMAFTEFTFGVVRPNTLFKPNWHLEALAHKLSQVEAHTVTDR